MKYARILYPGFLDVKSMLGLICIDFPQNYRYNKALLDLLMYLSKLVLAQ
jgi:predicted protein tyrosine phosphatase